MSQIERDRITPGLVKTPASYQRLAPLSAAQRSRVSNGADVLPGIDGRSALARRYRDIAGQIIADMGGLERCSEAKLQLIRRFAAASVLAEQIEARLANGDQIDIAEHSQLSSTLTRLASRIGLSRHAKLMPTLQEYLVSKQQKIEAAE